MFRTLLPIRTVSFFSGSTTLFLSRQLVAGAFTQSSYTDALSARALGIPSRVAGPWAVLTFCWSLPPLLETTCTCDGGDISALTVAVPPASARPVPAPRPTEVPGAAAGAGPNPDKVSVAVGSLETAVTVMVALL